jgi:hypothetical protein
MDAAIAQGVRESVREDWTQMSWSDIFLGNIVDLASTSNTFPLGIFIPANLCKASVLIFFDN